MTKKTTPAKASKSSKASVAAKKRTKAVAEAVAPDTTPPAAPQLPTVEPVVETAATDATVANENASAGPQSPAPEVEAKAVKAPKEPKIRKPSGLDAAVQVLQEKGEPMSCKDIVEKMLTKGLWKTGGKTPAATIYSAILREIDGKPGDSRFVKTGRGLFGLTNAKA